MKFKALLAISLPIFCAQGALPDGSKPASLDDLKKLDIICFVPRYLPKDFKFKSAEILTEENAVEGQTPEKVVTYGIEWSGPNDEDANSPSSLSSVSMIFRSPI